MAQAFPCSSSIWLNLSSVMPNLMNLCVLFQRALDSGATTRPGRLSAETCRCRSILSGDAQGGACPAPRAQYASLRGIHLPHRSPVGLSPTDMVFTHPVGQSPRGVDAPYGLAYVVGDAGFEPATSPV
jgi:hypothetical protein